MAHDADDVAKNGKIYGGWGGIRTHDTVARVPVFKTGALNRSATHPVFLITEAPRRAYSCDQCGGNVRETVVPAFRFDHVKARITGHRDLHMNAAFELAITRIEAALAWLPGWLAGTIIVAVLIVISIGVHAVGLRLVRNSRLGRGRIGQLLIARGAAPSRLALVLAGIGVALPALGFSSAVTQTLLDIVLAAILLVIGWAAVVAIGVFGDLYLARYHEGLGENILARKHVTQVRVLRRASQVVIGLICVAAALMTLPAVRQYGVSLFASAGAAGIVVGLAARPVLSNLLAGIQIALTQPIRVEDSVVIDGEWGWVEDITSTYIVVRTWDWRRLVVPLSRFLEQSFQNWTRENPSLIGSVHLHVDYTTPIEAVRSRLEAIARESKLWDGSVVNLQVVEATAETIQLRALVSARNASDSWDLRCFVREQLIAYLQTEMPHALPRRRLEIESTRRSEPQQATSGVERPPMRKSAAS